MSSTTAPPPTTPELSEPDLHEPLRRAWHEPGGFFGWFQATTHQAIGMQYIVTAFIFLLCGGMEALLMRLQLARPDNALLGPRSLQPDLHHARHHDDVPFRGARDGRYGRLARSADAGDAQCGVSAAQRIRVLDVPCRRAAAVWRRVHRHDARCRMVRLHAAFRTAVLGRKRSRRVGADDYVHGNFRHVRRGGIDCHDRAHARAGDDAQPHSAVLLVDARAIVHGDFRHAGRHDREYRDAAQRSHYRHAFRESGGRRRPAALPAHLLVLRPSRGLHHLHSRAGDGLCDSRSAFAPPDFRLYGNAPFPRRGRVYRVRTLGASTCSPPACRRSAKLISPPPA